MKKCPFCAEEIQDEAIKCRHCGEFLDQTAKPAEKKDKIPWYFSTGFIVIAVLCVGPLALPLIWFRPKLSPVWKIAWTIIILFLSWILFLATLESLKTLKQYYEMLNRV